MRRYLGIIITILIVLGLLIALSAAGNIELDRPRESELNPIRSSYSTGATGTRAFYQLLEESGRPVARWREKYNRLEEKASGEVLVTIGPFPFNEPLSGEESFVLQKWVAAGGNLLVISRSPVAQFGDPMIHSQIMTKDPLWDAKPERLIDTRSNEYIVQPTVLTKGLKDLQLSTLAARLKFHDPVQDQAANPNLSPTPTPTPVPTSSPTPVSRNEEDFDEILYAEVIHIADSDGSMLVEFSYGDGRVVFLSDPFVVANNGIARGSNLTLAINLIDSMSGIEEGTGKSVHRIYFDEYHHGYRIESNPLVNYFRGTPLPWLLVQGLLLSLLIIYTYGKRFGRPLPLPQVDRHSPLEFVGSMANLQQVARARDLALENIYPRFKSQLCRSIGLSSRASAEEIMTRLKRQRIKIPEAELVQTLTDSEAVLRGGQIDDAQLLKVVGRMRAILGQIGNVGGENARRENAKHAK